MFYIALTVIAAYAVYTMRPEERRRVIALARRAVETGWEAYCRRISRPDAFRDALAARTRVPYVTLAIVLMNVAVFVSMLMSPGRMGDAETLVRWGGSAGPLTTNGEWWRVLTATFVHTGFVQLVVEMAVLAQAGILVERMLGHVAVAAVYVASAAFASAIGLWADPLPVSVGASGAILGLEGLLIAIIIRGTLRRSPVTIPMPVIARLAPAAAIFVLYTWASGGPRWTSGLAAFVIQFAIGLALTRNVAERKPSALRIAGPVMTVLAITMAIAAPLAGTTDVRTEITRLIAVEDRTTVSYQTATEQFKRGAIKTATLAKLIELVIVPELKAAERRLGAVAGVPRQQQPLVETAGNFLQLRRESWLLRIKALRASSTTMLREADQVERASLDLLRQLKSSL
jgi:membrane associated rhomboid family serine protease